MSEELIPTKREEEFLRGIMRAVGGEESSVPEPVWDYEKRLYDIWKVAKGEEAVYNLPVRTEHPDAFYAGILEALANGGGGGSGDFKIANVQIAPTAQGLIDVHWAISGVRVVYGDGLTESEIAGVGNVPPFTFELVLYKGKGEISTVVLTEGYIANVSITGSAEVEGSGERDPFITVTGDCSITFAIQAKD